MAAAFVLDISEFATAITSSPGSAPASGNPDIKAVVPDEVVAA